MKTITIKSYQVSNMKFVELQEQTIKTFSFGHEMEEKKYVINYRLGTHKQTLVKSSYALANEVYENKVREIQKFEQVS